MSLQRIDLLELDIDTRLADLWQCLWEDWPQIVNDEKLRQPMGVFMRAAYGKGYMDALKDKGELCNTHGYRLPPT